MSIMNRYAAQIAASAAVLLQAIANAQSSCSNSIAPTKSIQPSVASGYEYAVVATGLTSPRSVVFDSSGNLLVLEAGKGLSSHVIQDDGGTCVSIKSSKNMISDRDVSCPSEIQSHSHRLRSSLANARSCAIPRWPNSLCLHIR